MDILEKKVDTVFIRDLLAANAALDDTKAVGRGTPDPIANIRKLYMGNTSLPLDQNTYGIDNSKIVVASYLGLLQIAIMQGEDERMLCRYILHMFATGEVIVYKELLNSFYRSNFGSIGLRYEAEANRRKQNWKSEKILIGRYKRSAAMEEIVGGLVDPVIIMDPVPMPGTRLLGAIARFATASESEQCKMYVCQAIEEHRDQAIAEVCARKAKEELNQKDIFLLR